MQQVSPAAASVAPPEVWQYGVIGVMAFVFAGVIVYLFKLYNGRMVTSLEERRKDTAAMEIERKDWAVERAGWEEDKEKLRADFERRLREHVEMMAREYRAERETNRAHEDQVRKEFADMLEGISNEAAKSSTALVQMLDKFYERFVGPRRY